MINSQPSLIGSSVEFNLIPTIEFLQSQSDFYWGGTSSTLTICISNTNFTAITRESSTYFLNNASSVLSGSVLGKKEISGFSFGVNETIPSVISPEIKAEIKTSFTGKIKSFYIKNNNVFIDNRVNINIAGIINNSSISTLAPLLSEALFLTEKFLNTTTEEYFIGFASGIDCYYTQSELGYIIGGVDNSNLESSTTLIVPATIELNESSPEFTAISEVGSNQDFAYFNMIYLKNSEDILFVGSAPDVLFLYTNKNTAHKADLSVKQVKIRQELSWQTIII